MILQVVNALALCIHTIAPIFLPQNMVVCKVAASNLLLYSQNTPAGKLLAPFVKQEKQSPTILQLWVWEIN